MNKTLSLLGLLLVLNACTKEADNPVPTGGYGAGVYVVNEGPFVAGSGTLSYRSDATGVVETDVYSNNNGVPAGAILMSLVFSSTNEAWIVSNLSGTLEAVDAGSFVSKGKIFGLGAPRFAVEISAGIAAVSDWNSNAVFVVDMGSLAILDTFAVGNGPEQLAYHNGHVYVANSGGFARDSTISIINIGSGSVQTVVVGDQPSSLLVMGQHVYVLCAGYTDWGNPANNTPGRLVKLGLDGTLSDAFDFDLGFGNPGRLCADQASNQLYFLNAVYGGSLYSTDAALGSPVKVKSGTYYSTGFDPFRGYILLSNPLNYSVEGYAVRLRTDGSVVDSFQVGLIPTNFAFR